MKHGPAVIPGTKQDISDDNEHLNLADSLKGADAKTSFGALAESLRSKSIHDAYKGER